MSQAAHAAVRGDLLSTAHTDKPGKGGASYVRTCALIASIASAAAARIAYGYNQRRPTGDWTT